MAQGGFWQTVIPGTMLDKIRTLAEEGVDIEGDQDSTLTVLRYWQRFCGLKLLEENLLRLDNVESIVRARRKYLELGRSKRPRG